MKSYISVIIICCCTFLFGSFFSQNISSGINGGVSIPQLKSSGNNEISKDYSSRLAATFGLFADVGITQQFSVKVAVNYAGQGGKRQGMQPVTTLPPALLQLLPPGTMLYADFKNEAVLNYLEVPVTAKFTWGSSLKYYLNAGPYIGILLSASQKTNGNSLLFFDKGATQPVGMGGQPLPAQSFKADTDIKKDINPVNVGITGGIGIAYPVGSSGEVILDARGAYGLTTIQKNTDVNGKSRTGGLFLTLAYAYTWHR